MTDLSQTIAPKSDQLNADDLIGNPRTVTVSRVSRMNEPDQPIAIHYEGDGGKPYKPCKSMRRVLVMVWGNDGTAYAGRRMTLYRDDAVVFGGVAVGGIRISHVSGIDKAVTMALTVTRTSRKPYTVKPLPAERRSESDGPKPPSNRDRLYAAARAEAAKGSSALRAFRSGLEERADRALDAIGAELDDLATQADDDPGFNGDDPGLPGDDSFASLEHTGA